MKRHKLRKSILLFSLLIFPITFIYMSPYLTVVGTIKGVIASGLLFWVLIFITSLVFGRAFCSYACPLGALQIYLYGATGKKIKRVKHLSVFKFIIWIIWVAGTIILSIVFGGYSSIDIFFENPGFPPYDILAHIIYFGMVISIFFFTLYFGKMSFCHYLCPFSVFMIIGTKIKNSFRYPSLRIISKSNKCVSCKRCNNVCPMSLPVMEMVKKNNMRSSSCILCGNCIDKCKPKAIEYSCRS